MNLNKAITRRKILLWVGSLLGVILLVITVLAVYIGTRSNEWWRDQLTSILSQTLGRKVEIQGEFHLDLGRTITTEVTALRISNPAWSESKDMLQLGSLLLKFDLLSALGDTLLIHRLELADIQLALEENQSGQKNWEFPIGTKSPSHTEQRKEITLPVYIEQLSLLRTQLSMSQPRWERPLVLKVEAIAGGQTADDSAVLEGKGQLGDLPFTLNGSMGKLSSALNKGPVSYQLNGTLGKASLHSAGSIDSLTAPFRPRIKLSLKGPEIMQITQAMGAPKIAEGPFDAQINIMPRDGGVSGGFQGKFGQLQFNAAISAQDLASTNNVDLTAHLSGADLAAFADLLRLPPLPKAAFEIDTALHRDDHLTRIEKMTARVGEHRITLGGNFGTWPKLANTRLELDAKGPDLAVFTPTFQLTGLGQLPAGVYSANVLIESSKNGLQVRPSKVTAGGYQLTAEGQIFTVVKKDGFRVELKVNGSGPDLSMITRLVDTVQLPAWPFQAQGKIAITANDITIIGATGTAGKHTVAADGPVAFSSSGPLRLDVEGSGPSLQAMLQGLGYDVIPASAPYQVTATVELVNNRLAVIARHARLGPAEASAKLSIPDLNIPEVLIVDVAELKTNDTASALGMVGMKLDFLQVMPSNLSGQIRRTKNTTSISRLHGYVGETNININGTIGDPPEYRKTNLSLDISGPHFEHYLDHPVNVAIPFQIKGNATRDKNVTRFENLQLKLANIEATVHGRLGNWENLKGSELTISAQGPNVDAIAAILDRPLPAGAIKFDGHVRGTEDAFHIDRMNAEFGHSNLSGDLNLTRGQPPLLKGQLSSSYLDFAFFQEEAKPKHGSVVKTNDTPSTESEIDNSNTPQRDAPLQRKRKEMFPDVPIKLEVFNQLDLDLEVRIDEIVNFWKLDSLRGIKAGILLKGGNLSVSNLEASGIRDGKVKGNLAVSHDNELTSIDIDVKGEQLRLGLAAAPGQAPETIPPTDVEVKFTGTGSTYRKLVTSLTGRIKGVQSEGRVNNSSLEFLLSDVLYELFETLNPFSKTEKTTRLNCGVYIVNLHEGKAEIQSIVIQAEKLTIVSAGIVDLNTEELDINFETRPRKGLGISASMFTNPYIKLGGTITKPAIELSPERATIATGAAVLTGGLSFLYKGLWDRYFSSRDPCGEALKRDAELQAEKAKKQ